MANLLLGVMICCVYFTTTQVHSQVCLRTDFQGYRSGQLGYNLVPDHHQAIIPSYNFTCDHLCGNITEWGVVFQSTTIGHQYQSMYSLDLQVWRPSPTVNYSNGTGCYSLVGNNRFTSVSLSNFLAKVTPSPQDRIRFQAGDVLGFHLQVSSTETAGDFGVVVLTGPSTFSSELVWHASIVPTKATSLSGNCPYTVGSSEGVLNSLVYGAPVIYIETVTYPCSTLLPTEPIQTASTPNTQSNQQSPLSTSLSCVGGKIIQSRFSTTSSGPYHKSSSPSLTLTENVCSPSIKDSSVASSDGTLFTVAMTVGTVVSLVLIGITVFLSLAVYLKTRNCSNRPRPAIVLANNEAYGMLDTTTTSNLEEISSHTCPEIDHAESIEVKQNKAYGEADAIASAVKDRTTDDIHTYDIVI